MLVWSFPFPSTALILADLYNSEMKTSSAETIVTNNLLELKGKYDGVGMDRERERDEQCSLHMPVSKSSLSPLAASSRCCVGLYRHAVPKIN